MVTGSLSRRAGGLFHSVRQLSLHLAARGVRVSVIGLRDADTEADLEAWSPLRPIILEPGLFGTAAKLARTIEETQPDVVHQHGIWLALSRSVANWAAEGGATIISPRGMLDPWALSSSGWKKRLAWYGWEERNLNGARVIHALADAEADAIRNVLPRASVITIPNAVPLPENPVPARIQRPVRELLFMARLHRKKGLADLLVQWSRLPPDIRSGWRLIIAGPDEGGHRGELEALALRLGLTLSDELRFIGPVSDTAKADALASADAFVLPSHSEGLPMAVLEAWAVGLPILMTRACNLPEGFEAGAAAEIDTGEDPGRLAAALARPDLPEMGLRGRALVEQRFTWKRVSERYEEVYERMANRGSVTVGLHD